MEYPDNFPEHLRWPVDAAIHAAEIAFIDAKQGIAPHRFQYEAERLILRYVETVFFAFATQAVQAGKEGAWNGERIRRALPEFLDDLGHRAYFEKHPDPGAYHGSEWFMEALNKASKNWKGWRAIHEGLKQVAELQAAQLQLPTAKVPAAPAQPASARVDEAQLQVKSVSPDDLREKRRFLLADYKAATSNPSNKRIYEAKNSSIHKPQFYQWLEGRLPASSATTKNFERFLRERKPPIPRKA